MEGSERENIAPELGVQAMLLGLCTCNKCMQVRAQNIHHKNLKNWEDLCVDVDMNPVL